MVAPEIDLSGITRTLEGAVDTYCYSPHITLEGSTKPFLAQGLRTQRQYVLKNNDIWKEGFEAELAVYQKIQQQGGHPAIPALIETIDQGSLAYLVLPYLCGENFDEVLRRLGPLSPTHFQFVLETLCSSLQFLHEHNILHRDVKLENVRLSVSAAQDHHIANKHFFQGLETYLFDFNISTVVDSFPSDAASEAMGTPLYISPEFWQGEKIDPRHDLYALAVLTFKALTQQYPYRSMNDSVIAKTIELRDKHIHHPIPSALALREDLPARVDIFFSKALAKNPNDRFQTAAEFQEGFLDIY